MRVFEKVSDNAVFEETTYWWVNLHQYLFGKEFAYRWADGNVPKQQISVGALGDKHCGRYHSKGGQFLSSVCTCPPPSDSGSQNDEHNCLDGTHGFVCKWKKCAPAANQLPVCLFCFLLM